MKQSRSIQWFRLNFAIAVLVTPLMMVGFQNCAQKNFDLTPADVDGGAGKLCNEENTEGCVDVNPTPTPCEPNCTVTPPVPNPTGKFELIDQIVNTNDGTPVEFNAKYTGDRLSYQLSFQNSSLLSSMVIPNVGTVEVINQTDWRLRFTPLANFSGSKDISLHAMEGSTKLIDSSRVTLSAGVNTVIPIVQPALAVRGSACVMCHADVRSNIITDFGYGGDGKGRDYYFGKGVDPTSIKWNDGSIYGDHNAFNVLGNWANLNLESGRKVYVPKNAPVTGDAAAKSGKSTLKEYLHSRFALSPHPSTVGAQVAEYSQIFIGAPSAGMIRTAFGIPETSATLGITFIKAAGAPNMSGIGFDGQIAKNTGTLICDGDLMVNGTLLLKNLKVLTKNGCRIYATGSVFVYGPIVYEKLGTAGYENANLQISSAKAIMMGLGELSKTPVVNGVGNACESNIPQPTGLPEFFYLKHQSAAERNAYIQNYQPSAADLADYDKQNWNSMYMRMTFWTNESNFFRHDNRSGVAIGKDIWNEYLSLGTQYDAACEPEKRSVTYTRLLLNAPQVHSRYWGDFNGVIISEYILPALGNFHFKYDPVFLKVGILPKLKPADYLKVE